MVSMNSSKQSNGVRIPYAHGGRRSVRTALMVILAFTGLTRLAQAQGKVITISEVTIVGRVQKPIAAVDVSRIQPKMTLGELRQPFLDRIEEAIYHAPF